MSSRKRELSSVENIRHGIVEDCVQVVVGREAWRKEWISGPVRVCRLDGPGPMWRGNGCGPTNLAGWVKPGVSFGQETSLCVDKLRLW